MEMLAAAATELPRVSPAMALELLPEIGLVAMYEPDTPASGLLRFEEVDEAVLTGGSLGERMMLCLLAYRRMWRADDASAWCRWSNGPSMEGRWSALAAVRRSRSMVRRSP